MHIFHFEELFLAYEKTRNASIGAMSGEAFVSVSLLRMHLQRVFNSACGV